MNAAATDQNGDGLAKNAIPVISPVRPKIAEYAYLSMGRSLISNLLKSEQRPAKHGAQQSQESDKRQARQ